MEFVLSFAQEKLAFDLKSIILWGFSLGTGPTIEIASRYQNLGGIVLQSPLASLMIWMDKNATWDYAYHPSDVYCSINKIEYVKAKLFVIHGKRDKTIEVRHSHLLYDKYIYSGSDNNQIWLVIAEGAGHNDVQFLIEDSGGPFFKRIQKFLDMIKNPLKIMEAKIGSKNYDKYVKREENRSFFYEKEKNSLKISFLKILINVYEKNEGDMSPKNEINEDGLKKTQDTTDGGDKEIEEKQFYDLLKKNDSYFSKEIPHDLDPSLLKDFTLKKSKSATNSRHNGLLKDEGIDTVKDFKNVNELLIKNYFEKI